jgi:hypothetical protein
MTNCQIIPERCRYNLGKHADYSCPNGKPCIEENTILVNGGCSTLKPVVAKNVTTEKQSEKPKQKMKRKHSNAGIKLRWQKAKSLGLSSLSQLNEYEKKEQTFATNVDESVPTSESL